MQKIVKLFLGVLGLMLIGLSQLQAETRLIPPHKIVWKDFLGVNAHFLWFPEEKQRQQMEALKKLGLEWVRVDLHWDRHESKEGQFDFIPIDVVVNGLKDKQLKSVFYLVGSAPFATTSTFWDSRKDQYPPKLPGMFADRMVMLAKRYPSVDAWQVWNEPNLPTFWRPIENPKAYLELLQPTILALKKEVPLKPVVMAGMAYFSQMPVRKGLMLEELSNMGALKSEGAIVAYHPYSRMPEGDVPKDQDFVLRVQQINPHLRAMKVPGIWATEWGWSSYAGPMEEQEIIGEDGQADYLLRRLALMAALDFDRIFLFALSDLDNRATNRDRSYGLLDLNGKPKPAYLALANFLSATGPELLPDTPPSLGNMAAAVSYSIAWKKSEDTHLWMFWGEKPGEVFLTGVASAKLYQPLSGKQIILEGGVSGLKVPVSKQLQILEWRNK